MDHQRFDDLVKRFGGHDSRRSLIAKLAKGGVAAALAGVGISQGVLEDTVAAPLTPQACRKRCQRAFQARRRRGVPLRRNTNLRGGCFRRCRTRINQINQINHLNLSTPIGVGVTVDGGICLTNEACQSGNCLLGSCAPCLGIRLCGDACCLVNASCVAGLCVVPGGLLG